MPTQINTFKYQRQIAVATLIIFVFKLLAWGLTHSIAILTDALEYTINVVAGFISLYSAYLSAQPKDANHPYGHGKVEFLSAAFEGLLMIFSCGIILYEAIINLYQPHTFHKLDNGILILAATALVNFIIGAYAVQKGKKANAILLTATGKHMQSDTYGTLGIVVGLVIMYFTNITWIDSAISIVFALIILRTGYGIIRGSIAGIMDEADEQLLQQIVAYMNQHRRTNWIDIHNLRIIKYGSILHLDCHLTIPWYFNINEGHAEVQQLEDMVKSNFGSAVELFIHTDGCLPFSCKICQNTHCQVRQAPEEGCVAWTVQNISSNNKHTASLIQPTIA